MRVLVIGGGIAGLGAATYFARDGHSVTVLEAQDRVGGRAVTCRSRHGHGFDGGTQYFHNNYQRARALMAEVGLADQLYRVAGNTRFFDDRARHGSFLVSHRLPWFPPAGLDNLRSIGLLSMLLTQRFDTFGLNASPILDIDAWDRVQRPRLREFVLRPLLLAGALAEPDAAPPSLLHVLRLLKIVVFTDYLVLPGGIASFHEALAARLDVHLETPVQHLLLEGERVVGVQLAGSGRTLAADHVVVATTPLVAANLTPEDWQQERAFLQSVTIPQVALPTFFLDRPIEIDTWSYMSQSGQQRPVSFIVDAARKNPKLAATANSILQAWPCFPQSAGFADLSDYELIERCRVDLERYFPNVSSWIIDTQVTRHPYAVPFHQAGHQQRAADFLRRIDSRSGVSYCGDYLSGGYVESALWSAERAARHQG